MINISYVAAYDPYHTILRMMAIIDRVSSPIPVDTLRILDFYLCFPYRLQDYRAAREGGQVKAHNQMDGSGNGQIWRRGLSWT